jgi:hypothetical protein
VLAMPSKNRFKSMSAEAQELLQLTSLRVNTNASARRIWSNVLTPQQRRRVGRLARAYRAQGGTVGIWVKLHGGSEYSAIIELGRLLNFLDDPSEKWLRQEIGEKRNAHDDTLPEWNPNRGKLLFDGKPIRSVRMNEHPSHYQLILDAFQAAGWSERIRNPIPAEKNLSAAIYSLNTGLKRIKFHAQEGGSAITWGRR